MRPSSRPKIVVLSPAVAPPHGGVPTFTEGLVDCLDEFAQVFLLSISREAETTGRRRVLKAVGPGAAGRLLTALRFFLVAVKTLREVRPDAVHAVTWRSALPVAALPRRYRPILVVECLGSELLRVGRVTSWTRRIVFRRAVRLVAISSHTAGVVRALISQPVHVINPVLPSLRGASVGRSAERPLVLCVARFVERKGHVDLLRVVQAARQRGARCRLVLAGEDGPTREVVQDAIRSSGASWASVVVDADDGELNDLYAAADVFALLTRDDADEFEGFGIVFTEAAARGLPVIAGSSGGVHDAVADGENGIVVSSMEQAIDAIFRLCTDEEERLRMSLDGPRHAQRFSLARISAQFAALYQDLGLHA
jgi:phosphatidylinositol alpha-1,6-mannosyltransferase